MNYFMDSGEKQIRNRTSSPTRAEREKDGATSSAVHGLVIGGAAVWAVLAVLAKMGVARIGAIELIFLFAPLVIVPLGMELGSVIADSGWAEAAARRVQPWGAGFAVAAMCMAPGRNAGLLALGWMVVCGLMAWGGVMALGRILWQRRTGESPVPTRFVLVRAAVAVARIDLAVGGLWLVASRLGMRPMGIQEPIGLLTAVHFHYAGFATGTIGAATLSFVERRGRGRWVVQRWFKGILLAVVTLPIVVAAGFVISPAVRMGAATLFALSVAAMAVFLHSVAGSVRDGMARILLRVAAGAVFAGMVLGAAYAIVVLVGSEALTIPEMARTHGILNSVGFCLPGLLGWLVGIESLGDRAIE